MLPLRRLSGAPLTLTAEHEKVVHPRRGTIAWDRFDRTTFAEAELRTAADLWAARAVQEMHSLALFTEVLGQLHLLGAPLDWSGAFARMIADEVRHTDLCLRMCEALGHPASPELDPTTLRLFPAVAPKTHVMHTILAAFCVGETISGRMFRRALKAANVPLAREVVGVIVTDETFHGELGWELGALLMRGEGPTHEAERTALALGLPELFRHYAGLCCATAGPTWARGEAPVDEGPNFGNLSRAGYARAFFDGMEADVVPGLVAIGLHEAEAAYAQVVAELEAGATSA